MTLTVGELRAVVAQLDANLTMAVAVNGTFVPVSGITVVPGSEFVVIRGIGKTQRSSRFSLDEEGVLGKLAFSGVPDKDIAIVLGREAKAVTRKRITLGIEPRK